ncbi:hypothetical protein TSAR_005808 [Trichomalopsis sarcophagae]|uniref:Uncharacterized protein n=1 Tax=Trichomalopsis sarcophagae TaxID=543379 RepID=A0A232EIT3_9HYME|nr:hypothetical protein TSAR_005808 [Trichomalopsis sarcophagae]
MNALNWEVEDYVASKTNLIEDIDPMKSLANIYSFTTAHNPKTGILRSTYMRNKYYKQKFHYIQPIRVAILDDDKSETQHFFTYVPILETIQSLLMNDNVQPFCINQRKSSNSNSLFDVNDGNVIKNSNFFNVKNIVQIGFVSGCV